MGEAVVRLLGMGIGGGILLLTLSVGPPAAARALGSAAIVLISLTAILFTLCAVTLALRHFTHNRPGYVLILSTVAVAVYLFLHGTFGWSPFEEQLGSEVIERTAALPSGQRPVQQGLPADIVVNAYGGGLRAALFTAEVLADLDDRSCGEFGRRLERLSGVSGGSLGIAVYMLLRQEYVASGGWVNCTPSSHTPQLAHLVDDTLVQDHLSAAMARMLSVDLVPGATPRRGQALLDSWQERLTTVLTAQGPNRKGISLAGMALPLTRLNGGVDPAPAVFFNATDVASGKRVWFSNRGTFETGTRTRALGEAFQVGQAVLHSARFPFVSPAGGIKFDQQTTLLVDGGYADNSGAGTLFDTNTIGTNRRWLNIDGNPPDRLCADTGAKPARGAFSAVDALFAVRESQAGLAVDRYRGTHIQDVTLKPDLDHAFASTIKDSEERCKIIRSLHTAPLGWYLTPVTAGDQVSARFDTVAQACEKLRPLCGQ
jgi:predicted acylesterase/phospholipase RssA